MLRKSFVLLPPCIRIWEAGRAGSHEVLGCNVHASAHGKILDLIVTCNSLEMATCTNPIMIQTCFFFFIPQNKHSGHVYGSAS